MIVTDLALRHPAVDMDRQTLAEEMMMTIATGQPRSPAVVTVPVATITTATAQPRSPAAAMVPPATMMTATVQLRSPAVGIVPAATIMTIMDRGPRHLAVDTDLRLLAVETMTPMDREPRHPAVVTDLRQLAVETTMTTAMAPPRLLVAGMAVERTMTTVTALETNPAAAALAPETLVPRTIRQAIHLAATIGMTRAVRR